MPFANTQRDLKKKAGRWGAHRRTARWRRSHVVVIVTRECRESVRLRLACKFQSARTGLDTIKASGLEFECHTGTLGAGYTG